jgi:hypothetical protein
MLDVALFKQCLPIKQNPTSDDPDVGRPGCGRGASAFDGPNYLKNSDINGALAAAPGGSDTLISSIMVRNMLWC